MVAASFSLTTESRHSVCAHDARGHGPLGLSKYFREWAAEALYYFYVWGSPVRFYIGSDHMSEVDFNMLGLCICLLLAGLLRQDLRGTLLHDLVSKYIVDASCTPLCTVHIEIGI